MSLNSKAAENVAIYNETISHHSQSIESGERIANFICAALSSVFGGGDIIIVISLFLMRWASATQDAEQQLSCILDKPAWSVSAYFVHGWSVRQATELLSLTIETTWRSLLFSWLREAEMHYDKASMQERREMYSKSLWAKVHLTKKVSDMKPPVELQHQSMSWMRHKIR